MGGGLKQGQEFAMAARSAFASLIQHVRSIHGRKRSVLVLDNFEQIIEDENHLKAVASIIISADEEAIARHEVKLLLVGVPSNLRQLVSRVGNANTIANRLIEIPEVARMSLSEATSLMRKGFEGELKYSFGLDTVNLYKEICWKTDRIAQQIHELCLKIALEAERNGGSIDREQLDSAEKHWLEESFSMDLGVIENAMNSRDTKVGRKNQVIYSLGRCDKEEFKHNDIEKIVREKFCCSREHQPEPSSNLDRIFQVGESPFKKKRQEQLLSVCVTQTEDGYSRGAKAE
jgi:hypothetical protein